MHAAVQDVHHRHRQRRRTRAADVAVEWHARTFRRRLGDRKRDAENGVGAEARFVRRAVQLAHHAVDAQLFLRIEAAQNIEDFGVHGCDGVFDTLAAIAFTAITQFHRFARAGGSTGRHGGAAEAAVFQQHIHLHRGVATAVQNLASGDIDDGSHVRPRKKIAQWRPVLGDGAAAFKPEPGHTANRCRRRRGNGINAHRRIQADRGETLCRSLPHWAGFFRPPSRSLP